jgi:Type I restriction enzyme HindI endonuclease subunit-like, C-terminal
MDGRCVADSAQVFQCEVAFYDAAETNVSAVKVLGEQALKTIAR